MPKNISSPNNSDSDADLSASLAQNIKAVDPDRYRAAMLAAPAARARLCGLYAFHAELAKVPEFVSEPMMGAIRYQWWREAVDEIYTGKTVRRHEVATPLARILRGSGVTRFWVDQLIDGRERDLDPRPFADLAAAKDYCAQTSGKLMQIAVQVAMQEGEQEGEQESGPDLRLSTEQMDGINSAGLAWGLTGLARAYGYYHKSMLSAIDYDEITHAAKQAHQQARTALGKIPADMMPAIGYAALIPTFTARLTAPRHDPKQHQVSLSPLRKQLVLMGAAVKGRL